MNPPQQKKPFKTLVISDLHNHVHWVDKALIHYKKEFDYDEVVFLGDYFDHFGDGPFEAQRVAIWLKTSLHKKDRIHLVGNHDMPYIIPNNDSLWCPGYTPDKCRVIRSELNGEDFKLFRPAYYSNGYLFPHAGFSRCFAMNLVTGEPFAPEQLVEHAIKEYDLLKGGLPQPLFRAGSRMTTGVTGGITWCDWEDEFEITPGIYQIVGHTPHKQVRMYENNYDLDTSGKHVLLITDGQEPQIIDNYGRL